MTCMLQHGASQILGQALNIPASFYDRYIDPLFSRSKGVVYVLPETKPVASVFPFADGSARAQAIAQQSVATR